MFPALYFPLSIFANNVLQICSSARKIQTIAPANACFPQKYSPCSSPTLDGKHDKTMTENSVSATMFLSLPRVFDIT